jgi:hypothetical protein
MGPTKEQGGGAKCKSWHAISAGSFVIGSTSFAASASEQSQTVFTTGAQVPGLATGIKFNNFGPSSINDVGQVTFSADMTGASISATNASGVWF